MLSTVHLLAAAGSAEATAGAPAAARRRRDVFGVSVIAFVTALGGGALRD